MGRHRFLKFFFVLFLIGCASFVSYEAGFARGTGQQFMEVITGIFKGSNNFKSASSTTQDSSTSPSPTAINRTASSAADSSKPTITERPLSEKATATPRPSNQSKVSVDLKEALDSYEAFVDEYVAFMKSYDASDFTMLAKYMDMLTKAAEFAAKIEKYEEADLEGADLDYYLQVTARITKKMMEASLSFAQ